MKLIRDPEKICNKAFRLIFLIRWQQLKVIYMKEKLKIYVSLNF